MSRRETVLITGANRGLGLGLVRAFHARGWQVFAACRQPQETTELHSLGESGTLHLVVMDVVSDASVRSAAAEVATYCSALDVLVNNAGMNPEPRAASIEEVAPGAVLSSLDVNTVGPLRTTQAMLPLLRKSARARVVNISSGAGSLTRNSVRLPLYPYCLSKAALNLFTRRAADELRPQGIIVVSVSPGWVRTDMGGNGASLSVDESTAALSTTIENLTLENSGHWLDRFGQPSEYAW